MLFVAACRRRSDAASSLTSLRLLLLFVLGAVCQITSVSSNGYLHAPTPPDVCDMWQRSCSARWEAANQFITSPRSLVFIFSSARGEKRRTHVTTRDYILLLSHHAFNLGEPSFQYDSMQNIYEIYTELR